MTDTALWPLFGATDDMHAEAGNGDRRLMGAMILPAAGRDRAQGLCWYSAPQKATLGYPIWPYGYAGCTMNGGAT